MNILIRQKLRLQASEPHPLDSGDGTGQPNRVDQPQPDLFPVGGKVDPDQNDLFISGLSQL